MTERGRALALGLRLVVLVVALLVAACRATPRETTGVALEAGELRGPWDGRDVSVAASLERLVEGRRGVYGFVIQDVASGAGFLRNQGRVFPAASVYKIALTYEVLRWVDAGRLQLEAPLTIEASDAVEDEPVGGLSPGDRVTVRRGLEALHSVSSNAASHALLRTVGRWGLNRSLDAVGMRDTRVPLFAAGPLAPLRGLVGPDVATTTPADTARLLLGLGRGRVLREDTRAEMRRLLAMREATDPIVAALPEATVLAKTGNLEEVSNVAGLVEAPGGAAFVLTVFAEGVDRSEAHAISGRLARVALDSYTR